MKTINKTTTTTSIMIATLLIVGSSFMGMQNAFAISLTVDDHSFESQNLVDGAFTVGGPNTFWDFTASHSGYFDPTLGQMAVGVLDGSDVAWARSGATICQTLGETISDDRIYRLSVYVGDRSNVEQISPGFDIQLLNAFDDTVLASIDETDFPIVTDDWRDTLLEYDVPALDPSIGEFLKICLSTPADGGHQTIFDNVRLETLTVTDRVCNDDTGLEESICKTVIIEDESGNGIISVGEKVTYFFSIDAVNTSSETWLNVHVKDNFGGDLAVGDVGADLTDWQHAQLDAFDLLDNIDCDLNQTGKKTFKEHLECWVTGDGDLDPNETATVEVTAETDYNHGQSKKYERTNGEQGTREYTSCGVHKPNSGATIRYDLETGEQRTLETAAVYVNVFKYEDLSGDCDGDGFTDGEEIEMGTDPFSFDTVILDTTLVGSPGGSINPFADDHLSTGASFGNGSCTAYSGSVFVLDSGYISVSASGLLRTGLCDVPTLPPPSHDFVQATLHCDEGDAGTTSTVPLSSSAGATIEGDFDLTDSIGAIGTCTNATVFVESGPPFGNGKWLAKSP